MGMHDRLSDSIYPSVYFSAQWEEKQVQMPFWGLRDKVRVKGLGSRSKGLGVRGYGLEVRV